MGTRKLQCENVTVVLPATLATEICEALDVAVDVMTGDFSGDLSADHAATLRQLGKALRVLHRMDRELSH